MKGLYRKLILIFSLLSAKAFAVGDEIFVLQDGDKVGNALKSLFCELASSCGGDAFSDMVSYLNAGIVVFMGVIATGYLLKTINSPAVNGNVGGVKVSYHIIRFFLGVALALPVLGNKASYSTFNYLVYSVAEQGIALGSATARVATKDENLGKLAATSMMPPETLNLAHNLFLSSVCMRGAEKFFKDDATYLNSSGGKKIVDMGFTETSSFTNKIIKFGNKVPNGWGLGEGDCGQVSIPILQATDENAYKIATRVHNRTIELIKEIDKVAVKFVEKPNYDMYKEVMTLSYGYQQAIKTDAFNIVKNENKIGEIYKSVEKDGFIHLGSMTVRITDVIHKTNNAIAQLPNATGIPKVSNKYLKEYLSTEFIGELNKIVEKFDAPYGSGVSEIAGNSDSSWWDTIKAALTDPTILIKKLFSSTPFVHDNNDNIFVVMQKLGGWLMTISSSAFAASGFALLTMGLTPGIATFINFVMMFFLVPMISFAGLCLYVLPMIPVFIWYGAVISYLISCAGAIIVATFIPATMILGGDDFMGQSVNAFKQLLSMFFKPTLMVITYFLAMAIMNIIGQMIMPTFFDVWNLSQDNSNILTYLLSLVLYPMVFCLFMYFLITTVFKNTMNLSDQLISWIGGAHGFAINGGASEFGSAGGNMGAAAMGGAAGAAAGNIADLAKNSGGSGGQSALDRLNNSMPKPVNQQNEASSGSKSEAKGVGSPNSLKAAMAASNSSGEVDSGSSSSVDEAHVEDVPNADYSEQLQEFELGQKYEEAYQSLKDEKPNASHNEAARYAYSSAISSKFGAGSAKAVSAAGNGDLNSDNSKMMLSMYRTAQENNFTRSELKNISSSINESGKTGEETFVEFSKAYNKIDDSKNN